MYQDNLQLLEGCKTSKPRWEIIFTFQLPPPPPIGSSNNIIQKPNFTALPSELRIQIFEALFSRGTVHFPFGVRGSSMCACVPLSAQILRASKNCYIEGIDLLYTSNIFRWEDVYDMNYFLHAVPTRPVHRIRHVFLPSVAPRDGMAWNSEASRLFDFVNYVTLLKFLKGLKSVCVWMPGIVVHKDITVDEEILDNAEVLEMVRSKLSLSKDIPFRGLEFMSNVIILGGITDGPKAVSLRLILDFQQDEATSEDGQQQCYIYRCCCRLTPEDRKGNFKFGLEFVKWQNHSYENADWLAEEALASGSEDEASNTETQEGIEMDLGGSAVPSSSSLHLPDISIFG